jgi:hypothetical protein
MENPLGGEGQPSDQGAPPSAFSHDGTAFENRASGEQENSARPKARENSRQLRESHHYHDLSAGLVKKCFEIY